MKIYVGIDIAKLNHFAAAISSDGEIIIEPFKFTNDADGFQLLVSKLESFDKNSLIIGLESTAHYGDNLVRYLVTELYQVCVLNPIKTCQMRKNNVRKTKTPATRFTAPASVRSAFRTSGYPGEAAADPCRAA